MVIHKTINQIISECCKLAQKEYKTRHNKKLCKKFKFDYTNKWYMHNSESFQENEAHKFLWDFEMQTDHLILARRPDLLIVNEKKTCRIEDFDILAYDRGKIKENEKSDKYPDLASELKKYYGAWRWRWHQFWLVHLEQMIGKGQEEILLTTILLRSTRILRRVLETWRDCCHSNSSKKPWANAGVNNPQRVNNNNPIYQPLRSGRIWHKVNF